MYSRTFSEELLGQRVHELFEGGVERHGGYGPATTFRRSAGPFRQSTLLSPFSECQHEAEITSISPWAMRCVSVVGSYAFMLKLGTVRTKTFESNTEFLRWLSSLDTDPNLATSSGFPSMRKSVLRSRRPSLLVSSHPLTCNECRYG